MIIFMDKVRFLRIAVDLQADFLVGVLQLGRWDQVVPLEVGHVVHGLRVAALPLRLPVDVPQRHAHHTQQHEQRHQAHGQRNRRPLEAILNLFVGHVRGHRGEELAARPCEARGADAGGGRLARSAAPRANAAVEAGAKGALVQDSIAVPSGVAWRTGAGVVGDSVQARAAVDAGVAGALVDVDFAARAGKSGPAAADAHAIEDQTQTTCR